MPVTAKLSRRFYEALGDEVANELVEWFNQVDATYRSDLKTLNELNFQRFDAKLEQRIAGLEARVEQRFTVFEAKIEQRITHLESEFGKHLTDLEARFDKRLMDLDAKFDKRLTVLDSKWETRHAALQARVDVALADQSAVLTRRMFAFWAGTVIPLAGLILALGQFG
jgi:hypothetical protein